MAHSSRRDRGPGHRPALGAFLPALALCAVVILGWTSLRGQDVNWDLQNYHLYDVFSLLHGRFGADVAPGGIQSFLNPLPYVLPYLADRLLPPLVGGLVVATSQLVPIMMVWGIAWRLWGGGTHRGWVAGGSALCACTGAIVLTEAGTSFCDVVLSALPLLGLLLLLPEAETGRRPRRAGLLLAGGAVGAAVAIKPTGLFLIPALIAAALVAAPDRSRRDILSVLGVLTAGLASGCLLSDGAWALLLWRDYGSPVFPFMNRLFHAPSAASMNFSDPRYHWQSLAHAVTLPFELAGGTAETGEAPVRDIRFAVALPLSLAVLLPRLPVGRLRLPWDPLLIPCAWLLAGTAFWLLLSPIQRYAVSLELLAPVIVTIVAVRAIGRRPRAVVVGVAALLTLTTRSADFFHRPWRDAFVPRVPQAIPAGSTYGLLDQPLSYWVTAAPHPRHAFLLEPALLTNGGRLQQRLDRIIADAAGRLWLLDLDVPVGGIVRAEMGIHGIVMVPPCLRAENMVWIDAVFCRGRLAGPRADAASDLPVNQAVSFSKRGSGLIYEIRGWDATEADGTWAVGPSSILAFHPVADGPARPMLLTLQVAGIGGAPARRVTAEAGGGAAQEWIIDDTGPRTYGLCVGPGREAGDVVEVALATRDVRSLSELGIGAESRPLAFRLFAMSLAAAGPGRCGRSTSAD